AAGLSAQDFLVRMLSPIDIPSDMIKIAERVLQGEEPPMPQLAPTAVQFGVVAAWAILEFASGKALRREIRIDLPALVAPRTRHLLEEVRRMARLAQLSRTRAKMKRAGKMPTRRRR